MMKTGLIGGAGILCGGLYASGAFSPGEVYDKPVAEVRHTVENVVVWDKLTKLMKESDKAFPIRVASSTAEDGSVVWRFTHGGHELEVVRAIITAEGDARTRVAVEAAPGDALAKQLPGTEKLMNTEMIQDLIELAFNEQIDAAIEERPFDEAKLEQAAMTYLITHPRQTAEFQKTMETEMSEMSSVHQQMRPAEQDERELQRGATRPMTDARPMNDARPMTDLSGSGRYR